MADQTFKHPYNNTKFFTIVGLSILVSFAFGFMTNSISNSFTEKEIDSANDHDEKLVFEIAWFEFRDGVVENNILNEAQKINDEFLPSYEGKLYGDWLRTDDGIWIATILWKSEGSFYEAAQDVLTHEAMQPLLEMMEPGSMAWFHGFLIQSWENTIPQNSGATEISVFRIHEKDIKEEFIEKTTEEELLLSADQVQSEFLSKQQGFVSRSLFKTKDGWFIDVVHWDTKESAMKANADFIANMDNPILQSFVVKIDPKSLKMFVAERVKAWTY